MSINLLDEILNVPISFNMSALPFDPVTHLWFTGVNAIDEPLVLFDALTGTERNILDGICLDIETPTVSHQTRYYIRRQGYSPEDPSNPIPTDFGSEATDREEETAIKIIHNGQVFVIRNGHVYTMFGQKLR